LRRTTVFTRAPWVRTPQQVIESLFPTARPASREAPPPPRPENQRVWASLLKGKAAVIEEVAEEMDRRDPSRSATRLALTDGERALQIRVDQKLNVTLILDLMHVLAKLWKAAYVFHAEGSLEADLWVPSCSGSRQDPTARRPAISKDPRPCLLRGGESEGTAYGLAPSGNRPTRYALPTDQRRRTRRPGSAHAPTDRYRYERTTPSSVNRRSSWNGPKAPDPELQRGTAAGRFGFNPGGSRRI
jgi:hypothetical protein